MKLTSSVFIIIFTILLAANIGAIDKVPADTVFIVQYDEPEEQSFVPSLSLALGTGFRLDERNIIETDPTIHFRIITVFTRFTAAKLGVSYSRFRFKSIDNHSGAEIDNITIESGVRWFIPGERFRPHLGLGFELNIYRSPVNEIYTNRIGLNISTGTELRLSPKLAVDFELSQLFNHVNYPQASYIWPITPNENSTVGIFNGRFNEHLYNPAWFRIFLLYQL